MALHTLTRAYNRAVPFSSGDSETINHDTQMYIPLRSESSVSWY
jgi:hypothetical protein